MIELKSGTCLQEVLQCALLFFFFFLPPALSSVIFGLHFSIMSHSKGGAGLSAAFPAGSEQLNASAEW